MSDKQTNDLSDEQRRVLREKGTEAPFSGALLNNKEDGTYCCAECGVNLFASDRKFDSGSGWPSFDDVIDSESVILEQDTSHGMYRTEVICAPCGGHLGHVFTDGPTDTTGQRYCINSASLNFQPEDETKPMKRGDGNE